MSKPIFLLLMPKVKLFLSFGFKFDDFRIDVSNMIDIYKPFSYIYNTISVLSLFTCP